MKILKSNDTNHYLKVIPRFNPTLSLTLELKNEATKATEILNLFYIFENGILNINFNYNFVNKSSFQFKIIQDNEIIYRGKLFITNQTNLQDYECRNNSI